MSRNVTPAAGPVFSKALVPPKTSDFPASLKARVIYDLEKSCDLENLLQSRAWFDYRHLNAFERTCVFVRAYDRAAYIHLSQTAELSPHVKNLISGRGYYLNPLEHEMPWCARNKNKSATTKYKLNPRWTSFVKARRAADKRFMSYDDYCEAAISVALTRGWPSIPFPQQLCDDRLLGKADNYVEATIPAFVAKRYSDSVQFSDRFDFRTVQGPELSAEQRAYVRYVADRIVALYGETQQAERAWRGNQRNGRVPGSVGLYDALRYE